MPGAAHDPHDLARFVAAQAPVMVAVMRELGAGQKRSHWMWFVFPQFHGLGHSATAQRYAIRSSAEAKAFLAHSVLGPRLRECTRLVNRIERRTIDEIFGTPDDLKFRSCMTLFAEVAAEVAADERVFVAALERYFGGERDERTLELLREHGT